VAALVLLLAAAVCGQSDWVAELRRGRFSVEELMEARTRDFGSIGPTYVEASVTLPKGTGLQCDRITHVRAPKTKSLRVSIVLRSTGLDIRFSDDGLIVDNFAPAGDVGISQISYEFGSSKVDVQSKYVSWFSIPAFTKGIVERKVTEFVLNAVRGTPLASRSYKFFNDKQLTKTLDKLAAKLASGNGNSCPKPPRLASLTDTQVSVGLRSRQGFNRDGLELKKNGRITARLSLQGSLADHMSGRNVRVQSASLHFDPSIIVKGLAVLSSVRHHRGSRLMVDYASVADGLVALAALIESRGMSTGNHQVVGRDIVEDAAHKKMVTWLRENRALLPGIDLAKAFGV